LADVLAGDLGELFPRRYLEALVRVQQVVVANRCDAIERVRELHRAGQLDGLKAERLARISPPARPRAQAQNYL
jgi:hypothetical protein